MGRDGLGAGFSGVGIDFNSRARMGRDNIQLSPIAGLRISIHAPAWGATVRFASVRDLDFISIHAPAWGATSFVKPRNYCAGFQFTRPHGARQNKNDIKFSEQDFNSRARMGRDW